MESIHSTLRDASSNAFRKRKEGAKLGLFADGNMTLLGHMRCVYAAPWPTAVG